MPKDSQNICDELKSTVVCHAMRVFVLVFFQVLPFLDVLIHSLRLYRLGATTSDSTEQTALVGKKLCDSGILSQAIFVNT